MTVRATLVLVRGAGDLATGAAYRLMRAGYPVVLTELPEPRAVRLTVSFAAAVFSGSVEVEGVRAERVATPEEARARAEAGVAAVLVDPAGAALSALRPTVVVDARLAKRVLDTRLADASLVIALGPGFEAGRDCHAVVETNRGHALGRVYWRGAAEPDTGVPGPIGGQTHARVLRAPCAGELRAVCAIGDTCAAGELIAQVGAEPVAAPFTGVVRGLLQSGLQVSAGEKIGDIDPRARREHCFTISDKALAVAGGVCEALATEAWARGWA